jgi:hypothetical protein
VHSTYPKCSISSSVRTRTFLVECCPPLARWLSRHPTHAGDVDRRLEFLRRCGKISAGRTATAARGVRKALSAEFNSEAQRRS